MTYFGDDAGDGSDRYFSGQDYWRLPGSLLAQDDVTVAWQDNSGDGNLHRFCIEGDVDDYSAPDEDCNLDESVNAGVKRYVFQARRSASTALIRASLSCCNNNGAYQFVVEGIQHKVGLALDPKGTVRRTGYLGAKATLTNGKPVSNGVVFKLAARLNGKVVLSQTRVQNGGSLHFKLNLPGSWVGEKPVFQVVRGASSTLQASHSAARAIRVTGTSGGGSTPTRVHVTARTTTPTSHQGGRATLLGRVVGRGGGVGLTIQERYVNGGGWVRTGSATTGRGGSYSWSETVHSQRSRYYRACLSGGRCSPTARVDVS